MIVVVSISNCSPKPYYSSKRHLCCLGLRLSNRGGNCWIVLLRGFILVAAFSVGRLFFLFFLLLLMDLSILSFNDPHQQVATLLDFLSRSGFKVPVEAKLPCSSNFHSNALGCPITVAIHHTHEEGVFLLLIAAATRTRAIVDAHSRPGVVNKFSDSWNLLGFTRIFAIMLSKGILQVPLNFFLNSVTNLAQTQDFLFASFDAVHDLLPVVDTGIIGEKGNKVALGFRKILACFVDDIPRDTSKIVATMAFECRAE
mmetsp:Transcript_25136/g.52266  ORF Transcript_25136/g.52266 Transcript_25136/m.52266 type:complete len:256 (+) Transcript_25136:63-830(+)